MSLATSTQYRRETSDRHIAEVKSRWASSGYAELKAIHCVIVDSALIIRGSVSNYYYKQMAQETVRGIIGIQQIVNELTVRKWNET